jgi:Protein of unknown function (DUF1674)
VSDEQAGSPDRNDSRPDANGDGRMDIVLPEDVERAGGSSGVTATKTKTEIRGNGGLSPTRYGDWEIKGRCIDF